MGGIGKAGKTALHGFAWGLLLAAALSGCGKETEPESNSIKLVPGKYSIVTEGSTDTAYITYQEAPGYATMKGNSDTVFTSGEYWLWETKYCSNTTYVAPFANQALLNAEFTCSDVMDVGAEGYTVEMGSSGPGAGKIIWARVQRIKG